MAKCEYCGKGVTFGIQVSHSHRRSNRPWKPNVKRVKAIVNGSPRHVYVCTRCMRSGNPCYLILLINPGPVFGPGFFFSGGRSRLIYIRRNKRQVLPPKPRFLCIKGAKRSDSHQ